MNPEKPSEITRLIKAFGYSFQGLKAGWLQPAFRCEVIACIIMVPAALLVTDIAVERALLIGSLLLVLIVELLNSAIETAVDRISLERHELSGRAKDMGSAAVLLSLVNAAVIWLAVIL
jgi:diacylglycerol kinase (ATP)